MSPLRAAVVGAGAFGGWTALALRRGGAEVTLFDPWGPGNARASSGGETRVIRGMYGPDRVYTDWVARSFALWKESEARWGRTFYHRTGMLWMFESADDDYARASLPLLAAAGLPAYELEISEARERFPQASFDGVHSSFYEEEAGYLTSRLACQAVAEAFVREGGVYREVAVRPASLERLELSDGSTWEGDVCVYAGGPWLGSLFPDLLGNTIRPSRQEVFYFGTPAGDSRFQEAQMPCWISFGERIFYGIPGNLHRGFKLADDTRGGPIDPTTAERSVTPERLQETRRFLAERFPDLAGAPLLGSEVCQYENSPDGHFVIDRHPKSDRAWIVGGGSGHGFKLGPAVGEYVAQLIFEGGSPLPSFTFDRFERLPELRTQFEARS